MADPELPDPEAPTCAAELDRYITKYQDKIFVDGVALSTLPLERQAVCRKDFLFQFLGNGVYPPRAT